MATWKPSAKADLARDCYWLYVVTNCSDQPTLQEPINDPARFPWHEACLPKPLRRRQVKKVEHYWLEVDAMTKPMQVREEGEEYSPQNPENAEEKSHDDH